MLKKLNNLGFVIGIFFSIIALILIIGGLLSESLSTRLNFYTGFVFLVFGVLMASFSKDGSPREETKRPE